jgi:hypothetical protein
MQTFWQGRGQEDMLELTPMPVSTQSRRASQPPSRWLWLGLA